MSDAPRSACRRISCKSSQMGTAGPSCSDYDRVGVPEDPRQQIVEVVCNPAGQLCPDGLHLLGLAQLALEMPPLGHVFGNHFKPVEGALPIEHGPPAQPDGEQRPVPALPVDLHTGNPARVAILLHERGLGCGVAVDGDGVAQCEQVLRLLVTQHGDERWIHVEKRAVGPGAINPVGRPVNQRAIVGFRLFERLAGARARRVIPKAPHASHDLTIDSLRLGIPFEDPAVLEPHHVEALGVRLLVQVTHLCQIRVGVAHLVQHELHRAVVIAPRQNLLGNLPQRGELAIEPDNLSRAIDDEDALFDGVQGRRQQ